MPGLFGAVQTLLPAGAKQQIKERLGVPSVEWSLRNLRENGFLPTVMLDIGAYRGDWTLMAKRIWPEAAVLMIEADPARMPDLQAVAGSQPGVRAVQALLGAEAGTSVRFYDQESASSVLPETAKQGQHFVELPMRSLESLLDTEFATPNLIKLDVQGYELEVLKGGRKALSSAEVVLTEVNLIEIYQGAPPLGDVIDFLRAANFTPYDVCTLYRRPLDRALWQMDMIFVRDGSALLASKAYQ
jgi:FkbM family methyltransferase